MRHRIGSIVPTLVLALVLGALLVIPEGRAGAQEPGETDSLTQPVDQQVIDAGPPAYVTAQEGDAPGVPAPDLPEGEATAAALDDPGFTYQGRLMDGDKPAEGPYDLRFILYDAEVGGSQIGGVVTQEDVSMSDGLFTIILDFGTGVFPGPVRYVEIGVRPGDSADAFTVLTPRQLITPTPYATYAGDADQLDGYDASYFSSIYHDHDDRYYRKRQGTQFSGTLTPGQTKAWFTFGWPTDEIMYWSMHPTTDQGRVDWTVDVRLAGDTFTYYITVTNTGSTTTDFDANYVRFR